MTGLEFLQRLRQLGSRAPMIILTDVRDKSAVIRAGSLGVRDYVLKSCFSADRLLERIGQLIVPRDAPEPTVAAAPARVAPTAAAPPETLVAARQATAPLRKAPLAPSPAATPTGARGGHFEPAAAL